jgi:hypothetical protein
MLVSSSRNRHDFAKSRETREFAYAVTSLSCFDHEGCHRQPLEMTRIHFQSGSKLNPVSLPKNTRTCITDTGYMRSTVSVAYCFY